MRALEGKLQKCGDVEESIPFWEFLEVADELEGKAATKIYKQDWKGRAECEFELGARNVVYMLMDTKARLLYIGESSGQSIKAATLCGSEMNLASSG
jgi:hypothetical protein